MRTFIGMGLMVAVFVISTILYVNNASANSDVSLYCQRLDAAINPNLSYQLFTANLDIETLSQRVYALKFHGTANFQYDGKAGSAINAQVFENIWRERIATAKNIHKDSDEYDAIQVGSELAIAIGVCSSRVSASEPSEKRKGHKQIHAQSRQDQLASTTRNGLRPDQMSESVREYYEEYPKYLQDMQHRENCARQNLEPWECGSSRQYKGWIESGE